MLNIIHHIASSFYLSNFDEACGISIDGSGDFTLLQILFVKMIK